MSFLPLDVHVTGRVQDKIVNFISVVTRILLKYEAFGNLIVVSAFGAVLLDLLSLILTYLDYHEKQSSSVRFHRMKAAVLVSLCILQRVLDGIN